MMKKILVVDDEPHVIGALSRMLDDEFDVDTVSTGREAVELLAANSYDIVVSDMRLPDMYGTVLLTHVFDNYHATARLLVTAHYDAEAQDSIFALLLKPCSSAKLKQTIKDAIYWATSETFGDVRADSAAK